MGSVAWLCGKAPLEWPYCRSKRLPQTDKASPLLFFWRTGNKTFFHHYARQVTGALDDGCGMIEQLTVTLRKPGYPLLLGCHAHGRCFAWVDFPVVHSRQDVFMIKPVTDLIGQCLGGGKTHFVCYGTRTHVESPPENAGEAE